MEGRTEKTPETDREASGVGALTSSHTGEHEVWRGGKKGWGIVVVYDNNTVFLHGKEELAAKIEEILSPSLPPALVGCDEAGKGEGFGSLFAVCSIFPRSSYVRLRGTVSTLSTKKRVELSRLREAVEEIMGLAREVLVVRISARKVDEYNINRLLTRTYNRMLEEACSVVGERARAVVDDYGTRGLLFKCGELVVVPHSEELYPEVNGSALVAKFLRKVEERVLEAKMRGMGSHHKSLSLNDPELREFLRENSHLPFVRRSFVGFGGEKSSEPPPTPQVLRVKSARDAEEVAKKWTKEE